MNEVNKIKALLKQGLTKKYFMSELGVSAPTLNKRLKDGMFNKLQKQKINSILL